MRQNEAHLLNIFKHEFANGVYYTCKKNKTMLD